MTRARRLIVHGLVQGVGFRPFVARLAAEYQLGGWVLNRDDAVEIHVEGPIDALTAFGCDLERTAPRAASVDRVLAHDIPPHGLRQFDIRPSVRGTVPVARFSPDLPMCEACLRDVQDPANRRYGYPYTTCTHCGPRFSIVHALPYDRERTTLAAWPLCTDCRREYEDPHNRRFHAEAIACAVCGPRYRLTDARGGALDCVAPIASAAEMLREGHIVAIKGIGGFHLCCDATRPATVAALRLRKYRKSRPFPVMVPGLEQARELACLDRAAEELLTDLARPIVLVPARFELPQVAPGHRDIGLLLPYAPVHALLFAAGSPTALVVTSGNRSSEPIAFADADAIDRLGGLADAFLIGDRPIARRIDDSVVRAAMPAPIVVRRARGWAPGRVASLPASQSILAVGGDLKNSVTFVVNGEAVMSQHIGDLDHLPAYDSFTRTIDDLLAMAGVDADRLLVAHDAHPEYASTRHAGTMRAAARTAVQHHRAHVASVLAEHGAPEVPVIGIAFDGTGYGDDGTIWGGEFFAGSIASGLARVASIAPFALIGGDAASRSPVQAAAGLLHQAGELTDLTAPPFNFPPRFVAARRMIDAGLRVFTTTSAGRLFDGAAALLGFTGDLEYEGQAAQWLEQMASIRPAGQVLPFDHTAAHLDFRPTLRALIDGRRAGQDCADLARHFHETIASGIALMAHRLCETHGTSIVVLSGGTFQNTLLRDRVLAGLPRLRVWTNRLVPPNDGGLSLGQAMIAACADEATHAYRGRVG